MGSSGQLLVLLGKTHCRFLNAFFVVLSSSSLFESLLRYFSWDEVSGLCRRVESSWASVVLISRLRYFRLVVWESLISLECLRTIVEVLKRIKSRLVLA